MSNNKLWNVYIMDGNTKVYLRKKMTATETSKWLSSKCKHRNGNHFMCGHQVFCERR